MSLFYYFQWTWRRQIVNGDLGRPSVSNLMTIGSCEVQS
jgi:hypothetical protein